MTPEQINDARSRGDGCTKCGFIEVEGGRVICDCKLPKSKSPEQEQTKGIITKPGVSGVTRMTEAANCAACLGGHITIDTVVEWLQNRNELKQE